MLCEDDTRSRFPTEEAANSSENNSHNNENKVASIFDRLSLIGDDDAFTAVYFNNLSHIYQYDKKEITDCLEACGTADHLHKDKLQVLRLQLYEKICVIFTEYSEHEMYNRPHI